ncbi:MAG: IgGFc-binding protein [Polyangiales bacterium]
MPRALASLTVILAGAAIACGSAESSHPGDGPSLGVDASTDTSGADTGMSSGFEAGVDGGVAEGGGLLGEPKTCEEAAAGHSYIGCDYWPTVTPNPVWSIFDFAVVIGNTTEFEANVTITGPDGLSKTAKVPALSLVKVYLPWVKELKGPDSGAADSDAPNCTEIPKPTLQPSVTKKKGAFHLVSSRPVTVWQFNALEYKPAGGPEGKDWSSCPGNQYCVRTLGPAGCFSYTNDASLLLPTNTLTGTYRVTGLPSFAYGGLGQSGSFVAITGTQDGTTVEMNTTVKSTIVGGGDVSAMKGQGKISFMLGQGDVAIVRADPSEGTDLSGSLVSADKPVQVISGVPCTYNPQTEAACDHVEESVLPAETLGKRYVVAAPTRPDGKVAGHIVRLYGNVDMTTLTYEGTPPAGAPSSIHAGNVIDLGVVTDDFVVTGDHEIGVGTFMLAGKLVDPDRTEMERRGDPSASFYAATEQFRTKYVFLAPDDYDVSYAQIVAPKDATITLDGAPLDSTPTTVGDFLVHRVQLGAGKSGAHVLTSTKAVGLQVMGYGKYTSYQYPGGLDLARISPIPVK